MYISVHKSDHIYLYKFVLLLFKTDFYINNYNHFKYFKYFCLLK
jgi:hypothetical protein